MCTFNLSVLNFLYCQDIIQYCSGSIMVAGQWFYCPEEAEKKGGGSWKSCDTRELFYSFHRDENNALLARRLLNGELKPSKMLNMTPIELKMNFQHCREDSRRNYKLPVGLREIIHAGHGDRYQLECVACGNSWYASRDEVSALTIDASDSKRSIGTAPLATAKFEDVQKKLASPRESENSAADDISKKTGEPCVPVLDTQKSFGKPKKDDNIEAKRHADKE
ncbi:bromo-adjacent proteiny (BAH) domain-containing protein [Trifolium repens]|nr:bromo-adjacent proteiny (BAH) domain-containing protein [Trifolium repens]